MKLSQFFQPPATLIGLEFSSQSIQWVELSFMANSLQLLSHACIPIEKTSTTHSSVAIATALKQARHRLKPKTRHVALCIDFSSVLFKTIEIDKTLTMGEIYQYLQQQARKHLATSPDDLMLDFKILGPSPNQLELMKVQWVAARHRDLRALLAGITQAGLKPVIADINSYALQRAATYTLENQLANRLIAAIHLNEQSLLLVIFDQEKQLAVRNAVCTSNDNIVELLGEHIHGISHILLSGTAVTNELIHTIHQETGIETALTTPFPEIPQGQQFAISLGLAMRIQS